MAAPENHIDMGTLLKSFVICVIRQHDKERQVAFPLYQKDDVVQFAPDRGCIPLYVGDRDSLSFKYLTDEQQRIGQQYRIGRIKYYPEEHELKGGRVYPLYNVYDRIVPSPDFETAVSVHGENYTVYGFQWYYYKYSTAGSTFMIDFENYEYQYFVSPDWIRQSLSKDMVATFFQYGSGNVYQAGVNEVVACTIDETNTKFYRPLKIQVKGQVNFVYDIQLGEPCFKHVNVVLNPALHVLLFKLDGAKGIIIE